MGNTPRNVVRAVLVVSGLVVLVAALAALLVVTSISFTNGAVALVGDDASAVLTVPFHLTLGYVVMGLLSPSKRNRT